MRNQIIVANWKMNPASYPEAKNLWQKVSQTAKKHKKAKIIVAPPFVYIPFLKSPKISLAAQNVFWRNEGPYTGEISPKMLRSLGVNYVIIGHSERRNLGESDELINRKIKAALSQNLKVILAVGEKNRENEDFWKFLRHQLRENLKGVKKNFSKKIIIAYEPVWAIGSKTPENPETLYQTAVLIKKTLVEIFGRKAGLEIPILYGGSVEPENAKNFLKLGPVNGLLVGGASLDAQKFNLIVGVKARK